MGMLGFSVNLTTLFGLVLAIGIVVDDAIVVVENTSRHIANGMEPRPAAILAMQEVTGPIIATTLVLLAVFIPTAFLPGITGQLYRQFGLTISALAAAGTLLGGSVDHVRHTVLARWRRLEREHRPWSLMQTRTSCTDASITSSSR